MPAERLKCDGEPTFSPEGRQAQSKHEGKTGAAGCAVPRGAATKVKTLTARADLLLPEHVTAAYNGPRVRPRVFGWSGAPERIWPSVGRLWRYADHQWERKVPPQVIRGT